MMATDERNEILRVLQNFQKDYYTRGNAFEAYNYLKESISKIRFDDNFISSQFQKRLLQLKEVELITDLDLYAEKFAENLLKLILILKNSKK